MHSKKGLSGLVVAVLLLAVALTIGGLVMGWMSSSTDKALSKSTEEDKLINDCLSLKFKIITATISGQGVSTGKTLDIIIENSGGESIKGFMLKFTTTDDELFTIKLTDASDGIGPYSRKTYHLDSLIPDIDGDDYPLNNTHTNPIQTDYTVYSMEITPIIDVTVDTPVEVACKEKYRFIDTEEGSLSSTTGEYFTVVDPDDVWTTSGPRIDTNLGNQGTCTYAYRRLSSTVNGDFTLRFKFILNSVPAAQSAMMVGITSVANCHVPLFMGNEDSLYFRVRGSDAFVGGTSAGLQLNSDNSLAFFTVGLDYYIELERVGINYFVHIYDDSSFSNLLVTLTESHAPADPFDYIQIGYVAGGGGFTVDTTVEEISFTSS